MAPVVNRLPTPRLDSRHDAEPDYADAFEVCARAPDDRSAEQWARNAVERAPWLVRGVVILVHRHVLRFDLGPPRSTDHVLGWRVRRSEPDTVELALMDP